MPGEYVGISVQGVQSGFVCAGAESGGDFVDFGEHARRDCEVGGQRRQSEHQNTQGNTTQTVDSEMGEKSFRSARRTTRTTLYGGRGL